MDHRFTRKELYDLVWSEPISKLAKRFGLSDVGLGKICRRAGIPLPGRGYWAKYKPGRKTRTKSLPPAKAGISETIIISPSEARAAVPKVELPPDVQRRIKKVNAPSRKIVVRKTLSNPHPIVGAWIGAGREEQMRNSRFPHLNLSALKRESAEMRNRRYCILSALFKGLDKHGFSVKATPGNIHAVAVVADGEEIDFSLAERERQYRRELTKEEKIDPYNVAIGKKWRQVREPTGELVFRIRSWVGPGARAEWKDGPGHPLEDQLSEIITGFIVVNELMRRRRRQQVEAEHRRMEDLREQRKREAAQKAEEARVHYLLRQARAWRRAAEIRAYVEAVKKAVQTGSRDIDQERFANWESWALAHADRIDPLVFGDPMDTGKDQGRPDSLSLLFPTKKTRAF